MRIQKLLMVLAAFTLAAVAVSAQSQHEKTYQQMSRDERSSFVAAQA